VWWTLLVVLAVAGAWWLALRPGKPPPPPDPRCERALAAFRAKYPQHQALMGTTLQAGRDGSMVVTIVDMRAQIPPHRSWWRIDGDEVEELDHQRAAALIDIPAWR
jgi:hypothetical protein